VGVVTRAVLKFVPAPQQVRRFLLVYQDLEAMLHDERRLATDDRFDAVHGSVLVAPTGDLAFRLEAIST
jgi:cytokinin dehydrogenase